MLVGEPDALRCEAARERADVVRGEAGREETLAPLVEVRLDGSVASRLEQLELAHAGVDDAPPG